MGNTAKCEILHQARIDPRVPVPELDDTQLDHTVNAIRDVLDTSYEAGGRWICRVYGKAGRPCPRCGGVIRRFRQGSAKRVTDWCPRCQDQSIGGSE